MSYMNQCSPSWECCYSAEMIAQIKTPSNCRPNSKCFIQKNGTFSCIRSHTHGQKLTRLIPQSAVVSRQGYFADPVAREHPQDRRSQCRLVARHVSVLLRSWRFWAYATGSLRCRWRRSGVVHPRLTGTSICNASTGHKNCSSVESVLWNVMRRLRVLQLKGKSLILSSFAKLINLCIGTSWSLN